MQNAQCTYHISFEEELNIYGSSLFLLIHGLNNLPPILVHR